MQAAHTPVPGYFGFSGRYFEFYARRGDTLWHCADVGEFWRGGDDRKISPQNSAWRCGTPKLIIWEYKRTDQAESWHEAYTMGSLSQPIWGGLESTCGWPSWRRLRVARCLWFLVPLATCRWHERMAVPRSGQLERVGRAGLHLLVGWRESGDNVWRTIPRPEGFRAMSTVFTGVPHTRSTARTTDLRASALTAASTLVSS